VNQIAILKKRQYVPSKPPNTSATQTRNPDDDHILIKNSSENLKMYGQEDNIKWNSQKSVSAELVFYRIGTCDALLTTSY
jgi:hypothetical protein